MEEELKLLGLNDIDIKVYLTLLNLSESLASEIAKKAEIPRASVYDVLERLEKEGLVSHISKDFKKYFSAAEPETIIKNLEYKKQKIKDILPELDKIKRKISTETTKTEVYEGKKGLQTIMNFMLEEKEFFVMGASRKSEEILPFFMEKWHKERAKRKIQVKIIYNDIEKVRKSLQDPKIKNILGVGKGWNYKFLHVNYLSPVMTIVFGKRVGLINWVEDHPSAILIESKDIAETYKQYILNLWGIAKK
ncbi:MAG: helix-turn-helix domain-containing protein [Candidatus Nanoarchaeia archaeon]|nr:helix-turn-helix domain-containing protein [Candidatus Nanoarchaeia archaeon]MDD5741381.1 helix-turn-helix domain-containing protein [Candidatus Nanoarchaeia archaeon]